MTVTISNREAIATTELRDHALKIVESAYKAIDTDSCIKEVVSLEGNKLLVGGNAFDIDKYRSISVIGFGKASSKAALALESILGEKITGGIILDKNPLICSRVQVFQGSHPQPTSQNVEASEKIATLSKSLTEEDLAIVIVSGGGSSLLCWPQSESDQGSRLYGEFLKSGGTINELNIIRKHLSGMKGGGLAKLLYPATVVSLILCDVPGEHYDIVASGPTYFDNTTVEDAKALLERYKIHDDFTFVETPKDKSIFDHVYNVPVVSNGVALVAMKKEAQALGYEVLSVGQEWYAPPIELVETLIKMKAPKSVIIGGGEPAMTVSHGGGLGGRNEYVSSLMINKIPEDCVFVSFASDGIDNCSESAGGIIDSKVRERSLTLLQSVDSYLQQYKHDELLNDLDARIITGPTEANVSDLFLMVCK
ncbi:MAG: hypothetical protein QG674_174 [Patescibacteria group bacterium]|nr:hypothetical protein [Patescibacteria group bacterium]